MVAVGAMGPPGFISCYIQTCNYGGWRVRGGNIHADESCRPRLSTRYGLVEAGTPDDDAGVAVRLGQDVSKWCLVFISP